MTVADEKTPVVGDHDKGALTSTDASTKDAGHESGTETAVEDPAEMTTTAKAAHSESGAVATPSDGDDIVYPKGVVLFFIILSLCLAVFLVALDQTIIAPALGAITGEFLSVKDIVRNFYLLVLSISRFLGGVTFR